MKTLKLVVISKNMPIIMFFTLFMVLTAKAQICQEADALVNTYPQTAVCVAKNSGDPVLVLANAPLQTYQMSTYNTSATNNPVTLQHLET